MVFSLDVGDHIPTLQLMWPGWDMALREEGRGPPQTVKPPQSPLQLDGTGGSPVPLLLVSLVSRRP